MTYTEPPAFKLTLDCIQNSFRSSNKRHLVLTGTRKSGKSTMLSKLSSNQLPGITTWAEPGKAVILRENITGKSAQVGLYNDKLPGKENKMQLSPGGFQTFGIETLHRCLEADSEWISIDEIGYLETGCPEYCDEIRNLMDKKRVIAVVRKQSIPFLEELMHRDDVFCLDMNAPFGNMGCVIMASGTGKRFGSNKLMVDFRGKPLLQWILDATEGIFSRRIVVTRHREVEALCNRQKIAVICHNLPNRNDTVRLGLWAMEQEVEGCMFCPGDQPLLRWDTIASLAMSAKNEGDSIWRPAFEETEGSPVLFPKWAFPELLTLPEGKGGSFLIKKYPDKVKKILVQDRCELMDVDTPENLQYLWDYGESFGR